MCAQVVLLTAWTLSVMLSPMAEEVCGNATKSNPADQNITAILDEWQRLEPSIERASVRLRVYKYDDVFASETRSLINLSFEPRSRYLVELTPVEIPTEMVSAKRSSFDNRRYELKSGGAETWYADSQYMLQLDNSAKMYGKLQIPEGTTYCDFRYILNRQSEGLFESLSDLGRSMMAFIDLQAALATGTRIEELRLGLMWSLGRKLDDNRIQLTARPEYGWAARSFSRIDIILDTATFKTKAFRLIDPAGSKETVYVVEELQLNDASKEFTQPDVSGFRPIETISHKPQQPAAVSPAKPSAWPIIVRIVLITTIGVWW